MSITPVSVDALLRNTNALLYSGAQSQGVNRQLTDLMQAVSRLSASNPRALASDPLFTAQVKRLKQLHHTLVGLKGFGGTHRRGWCCQPARAPRQEYRQVLGAMTARAKELLQRHPEVAQAEATKRYGSEVGNHVRSIVDSGLPFGLMLVHLAAKLAEGHETRLKGIMRQLEQVSKSGSAGSAQSFVQSAATAAGALLGGPLGASAAAGLANALGGAATGGEAKTETALKAELQYWNSQYTNTMTLLSNLLKSVDQRDAAVTRNLA